MSAETAVTWIGPDDNVISGSDTDNYIVDQGSYSSGSKSSTLVIKVAKISSLTSGAVYKCKVKSSLYSEHSPEVLKEMVLTLLNLGW